MIVTRPLRILAALAWVSLLVGPGVLLAITPAASAAPDCPVVTVPESTKAARGVFTGTVTAVDKQPRTDGQQGAIYLSTVTVGQVYQGRVNTTSVQVQSDRNLQQCSLGQLSEGTEYMFFVGGGSNGTPWLASGASGTTPNTPAITAEVEELLGEGKAPVAPAPEAAEFTPVDTSDPQTLSRAAAPGAAMVIVGLLGLAVARGLGRRTRAA